MTLAFCMGTDIEALKNSSQPMAHIFLNSLGQKGALGMWVLVVLAQYVWFCRTFEGCVCSSGPKIDISWA